MSELTESLRLLFIQDKFGMRVCVEAASEIERLRDRLSLIATSSHANGWSKDRAKAALLDTP